MEIPARQMTLATLIERNARIYGGQTALVCGSTRMAFSELHKKAALLAGVLDRTGVVKGARVALLMRNCHRFIEVLFALSKLGAVLVPLNWRLSTDELLYIVRDSDSGLLIYGDGFEQQVEVLRGELGGKVSFVDAAGLECGAASSPGRNVPLAQVWSEDIAVQMYTAAFGGRPRGAQITHGGYLAEAGSLALALSLSEADSMLVTVPLFHTFGLELVLSTLARGGKCILIDSFDAREVSQTIEREAVSVLICAGPQLAEIMEGMESTPAVMRSLRVLMGSGAPKQMQEAVRSRAPNACFMDAVYGQTEAGAMVTGCDTEESEVVGDRCVGRPLIYQDVRVFGDDDAELPPGEPGEIVVRGPRVMTGYYKLPADNHESLRGGWLHTGDLGMMDEHGYLHYMGRKKELIKSGMENVYPVEVEMVLAKHPAVKEVAVIGIPDVKWDEAVTAVVVLHEGGNASSEELIQFCKERIASYKKPKYVHFLDSLPRDGAGQVARQDLKDRFSKASGG